MLTVICLVCREELKEPGALLFSPPTPGGTCATYHICVDCWNRYPNIGAALLRFTNPPKRPKKGDEIEILFDGDWIMVEVRVMGDTFIDYTTNRSRSSGSVLYASDLWRWPVSKIKDAVEKPRHRLRVGDHLEILTGSGWRRVRVMTVEKGKIFYSIFSSSKQGSIRFNSRSWRLPTTPADPIEVGSHVLSAILCEHANEAPQTCPCSANCYCKTRTCKGLRS